ncbi:MAG TPA: cysteine hydrolase [Spirochaetota bacterium]
MPDISLPDPKTSVVLTLDCQKGVVEMHPESARIFKPASRVLDTVRTRGFPVIHVGIGFRPRYPEIHPDHPTFVKLQQSGKFVIGTESSEFHDSVSPKTGEIIIYKHRVSAFSGNDLEMILRSKGIKHLVFFGIATSGIVLSTLRQASDMDFRSLVISDCCFDADEEVHRVLMGKVFPRQATVMDADEFIRRI